MAVTSTPIFPQTVQNWGATIVAADASNKKTIITAGANGTKVEFLDFSTDDTSARVINVFLSDGTVDYQLGILNLLASSGNTTSMGTPALSILQGGNFPNFPIDNNGNRYIYLKNGWSIKASSQTTVTAAKTIWIKAFGSDF